MIEVTIASHMTKYPFNISPDRTVADALELMQESGVRHLPVIEDERLVGIVSERDLKVAVALRERPEFLVADVMRRDLYVVPRSASVGEVARQMAERKMGSALITDSQGRLTGIFTTIDALNLLADKLGDESIGDYLFDEDYGDVRIENIRWPSYVD